MTATDELGSGILDLLFEGAKTRGELNKLVPGTNWRELDDKLAQMEKHGLIYQVNWRWFVSSKVIVRHAFREAFHQDKFPVGEFGNFLREFGAARKLGATDEEAWTLAKGRVGK